MKKTMKLFAAFTILLGFSMTGFSQVQNASNTIAANATVVGAIAVAATQSLEFGNLSVSGAKTIDLAGVASGGVTGGLERQGVFTVTKGANTSVDLSYTTIPSALPLTGGSTETLPITYTSSWTSINTPGTGGVGGAAVNVTQGATTIVPQGTPAAIIYVHLGGTVTPGFGGATTPAGSYASTVTLKAEFN